MLKRFSLGRVFLELKVAVWVLQNYHSFLDVRFFSLAFGVFAERTLPNSSFYLFVISLEAL